MLFFTGKSTRSHSGGFLVLYQHLIAFCLYLDTFSTVIFKRLLLRFLHLIRTIVITTTDTRKGHRLRLDPLLSELSQTLLSSQILLMCDRCLLYFLFLFFF